MEALRWAREPRPGLGLAASAVLLVLADRADDTGYAWPSVPAIMEALDCDRRTVMRALRKLEAAGLITTRRVGRRNVYTVAYGGAPPPFRALDRGQKVSKGGQKVTKRGAQSHPKPYEAIEAKGALSRNDENHRPAAAAYAPPEVGYELEPIVPDPELAAQARAWLEAQAER